MPPSNGIGMGSVRVAPVGWVGANPGKHLLVVVLCGDAPGLFAGQTTMDYRTMYCLATTIVISQA